MKILYVIDHLGGGGGEQQFVNIVNGVEAEERVFLSEAEGLRRRDLKEGVPVQGGYGRRRFLKSLFDLRRIIDSFRPDIVHAFLMYSTFLCAVALKISRHSPVFVAQEFSPPGEILREVSFSGSKKQLLRCAYRQADVIIAVSDASKRTFSEEGFATVEKMCLIYDGLNIAALRGFPSRRQLREELGISEDTFWVSFVGSLVRRKGPDSLVLAFRKADIPGSGLLLIGDGPERSALERVAGEDERIKFLGYQTNAARYIKASDIFVLPSLYEGLPNVIIEAMAVGTPVIATKVAGVPEMITDGLNGLLVQPRDLEGLREAILKLAKDGRMRERFATASMERADYFNLSRLSEDHMKLYRSLLSRRA